MWKLLKPLETKTSPFSAKLKTNEKPHWVRPELVAQIKFTEWTADGKLRHPVYLGLRDDKSPEDVTREQQSPAVRRSAFDVRRSELRGAAQQAPAKRRTASAQRRTSNDEPETTNAQPRTTNESVLDQLSALESARKDGVLTLAGGETLKVTNLHKLFWPTLKLTKGDLLRYYVRVAPFICRRSPIARW